MEYPTFYEATDVCPIHNKQVVMHTYGDPDSGYVCPDCEMERDEDKRLEDAQQELASLEQALLDAQFALMELA